MPYGKNVEDGHSLMDVLSVLENKIMTLMDHVKDLIPIGHEGSIYQVRHPFLVIIFFPLKFCGLIFSKSSYSTNTRKRQINVTNHAFFWYTNTHKQEKARNKAVNNVIIPSHSVAY